MTHLGMTEALQHGFSYVRQTLKEHLLSSMVFQNFTVTLSSKQAYHTSISQYQRENLPKAQEQATLTIRKQAYFCIACKSGDCYWVV